MARACLGRREEAREGESGGVWPGEGLKTDSSSRPLSSGLSPTSPSCIWEGIVWQMWYYRHTPMGFVNHSLKMGMSLYMYM